MWEGNVITMNEIEDEDICSREFWDIRKGVALRKLILQSL